MAGYCRSMIPAVARRTTRNIPWVERKNPEHVDNSDGGSADSSRCGSRDVSPAISPDEPAAAKQHWRHRHKSIYDENGHADLNNHEKGVETVELVCEHSESSLQDLLGLRVSGSRTAGVFVASLQAGSVAEKTGQIHPGDQLIQVDSICLIGLTPDQVVRVLRTAFSLTCNPVVRLSIAHPWADKHERHLSAATSAFGGGLSASKSESALAYVEAPELERRSNSNVISTSAIINSIHQDDGSSDAPPGFVTADPFQVKNGRIGSSKLTVPKQHMMGAMKLKRVGVESALQNTVTTALISPVPQSVSMMEIHDQVSHKKSNPKSGGSKLMDDHDKQHTKRKPSNKIGHGTEKVINLPNTIPGALSEENSSAVVRHRRKTSSDLCSAGSNKTTDSTPSRSTAMTDLGHSISMGDDRLRQWDSEDSLRSTPTSDGGSKNGYHGKKSTKMELSHMLSHVQRKTAHRKESGTTDDLPLVSFDQLNHKSPSPTYKRSTQSSSSGQSKSSKGSVQSRGSQGSQQLSWQCPVCLDGASRIRRTKRKMMSTACGHVFCNSCVEDVVGKYHICPTCRASILSMKDVHPIFM